MFAQALPQCTFLAAADSIAASVFHRAARTCWIPSSPDVRNCSEASALNPGTAIRELARLTAQTLPQVTSSCVNPRRERGAACLASSNKSWNRHTGKVTVGKANSSSCTICRVWTGHKSFLRSSYLQTSVGLTADMQYWKWEYYILVRWVLYCTAQWFYPSPKPTGLNNGHRQSIRGSFCLSPCGYTTWIFHSVAEDFLQCC